MSGNLGDVYHGTESGQKAPVIRIPYVVAGAIGGAVFFWQTSGYFGWGIGPALLAVLIGASLGLLAGLAESLVVRLMIAGALFGLSSGFGLGVTVHVGGLFFMLVGAAIGAGAGALLAGLSHLVRKASRPQ